jgi:hypothetical protein
MLLRALDKKYPDPRSDEDDERLALEIGAIADYDREMFFKQKRMVEEKLIPPSGSEPVPVEILIKRTQGELAQYTHAVAFAKEQIERSVDGIRHARERKDNFAQKLQAEKDAILKPINERRLAFDLLVLRRGYPLGKGEVEAEQRMRGEEDAYLNKEFTPRDKRILSAVKMYAETVNNLLAQREEFELVLKSNTRLQGYRETELQSLYEQQELEKTRSPTP